jgi:hypothetical protein
MERMRGEEGDEVAHEVSPEAAPALRVSVSCHSLQKMGMFLNMFNGVLT